MYNPATFDYFKHYERIGETANIHECAERVFHEIYGVQNHERNTSKKIKNYQSMQSHPFIRKVEELANYPKVLDGENSLCDEVFADYLVKVSKVCRSDFFTKVYKYVILFRECVNILYADKATSGDKNFTEVFNAEDAPDISNEFVTEFLDGDSNAFGFQKEEAIDLTQNFCQWLYDNNFTCSKLSLINNYQ